YNNNAILYFILFIIIRTKHEILLIYLYFVF
ncbi:hypothetical protein, partial [Plasmodium yoelii yoelii]